MQSELFLYNTATRSKEKFTAPDNQVDMYCCGPTVYNSAHIGNLRTYIFEDILKRVLRCNGFAVKHAVNITDVGHLVSDADDGEDKMEKGAVREGKSVWDIAARYTAEFKGHLKDLNVIDADIWPKATDHIPEMIALIKTLESRGYTYQTADGIYFDTQKFPSYCDFAKLDSASLQAGVRVDMGDKKSITDFALWKFSPKETKRQMEWESPWGIGFPGWHIECSAMSQKYLRTPIDIHCGGMDHVRVHHTNEIAQSEAATGKPFVRFWLHGEFLVLDKGKMAKSGGNFVTLETVKDKGIPALAYRMFCFSSHYRSPLTFSWEGLESAIKGLANLKKEIAQVCASVVAVQPTTGDSEAATQVLGDFWRAVNDDLNMPQAMAAIWNLVHNDAVLPIVKKSALQAADSICGLNLLVPEKEVAASEHISPLGITIRFISEKGINASLRASLVEKIEQRQSAKVAKDFASADVIRQELIALGAQIKDLPGKIIECVA